VTPDRADEAMRGMARVQSALRALAQGDERAAVAHLQGPPQETAWAAATLIGIVQDLFLALAGQDAELARERLAGLAESMDGDMAETGAALVLSDAPDEQA
jgi:hypothetical protein